ncbi:uncharacterized protein LOC120349981 [Nilaparvata lugens]|uniref:uncharacterized protein LOC120349981 n=1 Tax=Nilaparvata lugens TaxID=108931 RepID=UPI00193E694E|nr:uncharacterized protein LOC120349981 [Nilaparvata lugens]
MKCLEVYYIVLILISITHENYAVFDPSKIPRKPSTTKENLSSNRSSDATVSKNKNEGNVREQLPWISNEQQVARSGNNRLISNPGYGDENRQYNGNNFDRNPAAGNTQTPKSNTPYISNPSQVLCFCIIYLFIDSLSHYNTFLSFTHMTGDMSVLINLNVKRASVIFVSYCDIIWFFDIRPNVLC